ncbi:M1 family aminopeptidase [Halomonas vilamensis]|uniref:M1 family aminopeptidase n=1 Tax=Vreelandella vilamensis TaxID=531309 RepID=A0ABU1H2F4_9GAMM|nr:M1 family aminopeptidase [Halomonas vilamensis]MDR5898486.1 M1 family aminopeptidase [Halomonas vilamensis]
MLTADLYRRLLMQLSLSTLLLLTVGLVTVGLAWGEQPDTSTQRTLSIEFDPTTRALKGELQQHISQESRFRLLEGLRITSARRGDEALAVTQQADGRWYLPHKADRADSKIPVTLHWEGRLPASDNGSRHQVAVEGSLLPSRAGWYPHLDDSAASLRVTISVPAGQLAVATGSLIEEQHQTGQPYVAHFYHPHTREINIAAGPWHLREQKIDGVRLRTLFPKALNEAFGERYGEHAARQLALFQARLGPLPYDSFSIAASPAPIGVAFPGFTLLGERVIPLPFIPTTSLPHELMHAWWGAGVNVDYRSGNWAEALTTYLADYALAEQQDNAEAMRRRWLADLAALPTGQESALVAFRGGPDAAGRLIGYQHGAMLFHMLRQRIGDAAFDQGLRRFADEWMYRTADWQALIDAFSGAAGEPQDAFMMPWITQPGRPSLHLDSVDLATHDEGYQLSGTLTQRGVHDPWPLDVPLVVTTEEGQVNIRQPMHEEHLRFELVVASRPLSLAIDPGADLLRHPGPTPAILRQLMLDPDTRVLALDEALQPLAQHVLGRDAEALAAPVNRENIRHQPLLVIGSTEKVNAWQRRNDLDTPPQPLATAGAARFWMAPGTQIGLLSGNDARAITQLAAALRHHGQQSYVVQGKNGDTVQTGRWQTAESPLRVTFTKSDVESPISH